MAIKVVNKTYKPLKYKVMQMPSQGGGFTANGSLQPGQSEDVTTPTIGGNYHVWATVDSIGADMQDGSTVTFGAVVT